MSPNRNPSEPRLIPGIAPVSQGNGLSSPAIKRPLRTAVPQLFLPFKTNKCFSPANFQSLSSLDIRHDRHQRMASLQDDFLVPVYLPEVPCNCRSSRR